MSRLQTLLDRLPSHFANDPESNNYKLLSIVAENSHENWIVYEAIQKFWDVDTAEGIALDRLGKDEGISRGSWNDTEYRKMIKIQNIVNLSEGDIPTMNLILDAYMGEGFIGFQDGWRDFEPASLLLHVTKEATRVPDELIKRIKPAGVRVYILLSELVDQIRILVGTYGWIFNGRICGRFRTASRPGNAEKLPSYDLPGIYTFPFDAPIASRFKTETRPGAVGEEKITIHDIGYTFGINRKRCGHFRAGGVL